MTKTGPFFTARARAAAAESRQRRAAIKQSANSEREVFVVRAGNSYTWEIRRFGGIVLAASAQGFQSAEAARVAGEAAFGPMAGPVPEPADLSQDAQPSATCGHQDLG